MIRRIILIGWALSIPIIVYLAVYHGQPPNVTFSEAIEKTQHTSESDPASKVLVDVELLDVTRLAEIEAKDKAGRVFRIEYTGTEPVRPLAPNTRARFVGHVHGGEPPIFHATQVLLP